jgi:transposase
MGLQENPMPENTNRILKQGLKWQSKAKNLYDRFQKYERKIHSFMYDFSVPFSNNLDERDLMMMKLQQKISGTFRSDVGAT